MLSRIQGHRPRWGWLAVAVSVSIFAIMILGTMAQDRWCGLDLCEATSKY